MTQDKTGGANIPTIAQMEWEPRGSLDVLRAVARFPNGYEASVLKFTNSITGEAINYEVAVIRSGAGIDYTTPVANEVIGDITEMEANRLITEIANLPKAPDARQEGWNAGIEAAATYVASMDSSINSTFELYQTIHMASDQCASVAENREQALKILAEIAEEIRAAFQKGGEG